MDRQVIILDNSDELVITINGVPYIELRKKDIPIIHARDSALEFILSQDKELLYAFIKQLRQEGYFRGI